MKLKSIYLTCVFSVLFFCIPFFVKANMDIGISQRSKNVTVESYLTYDEFETDNRLDIIVKLAQQLIEQSKTPNLKVFIKIDNYGMYQDSYYTLGYRIFNDWEIRYYSEKKECKGLVIAIKDKDINIKKTLTILANALDKIDYIKSNQNKMYKEARHSSSNNPKFDTLISISLDEVNKYAFTSNEVLNSLSNEKIYVKEYSELDYYYQNFKFHIYTTRNYSNEDVIAVNPKEKDLLVVDNLLEIIGNYQNGYLVFTTDNTFHYLTLNNGKVKGEFKIDNVRPARSPIYKYQHKSEPMNLFIMRLSGYDTTNQVLFLPDSNLVIPNYAYNPFSKKNLDVAIKKQREKNATLKHTTDFKFNFEIAFYISLAIILGLLILIWQTKRK